MSIRVLITGSREFTDRGIIAAALTEVWRENGEQQLVVVNGLARGGDRISKSVADKAPDWKAVSEDHPANWKPEGPNGPTDFGAGKHRNKVMVAHGADVCLAFFKKDAGNVGTKHCVRAAEAAGIPVREFWQP